VKNSLYSFLSFGKTTDATIGLRSFGI